MKFENEKAQIQQEKEQLFVEQLKVKEEVNRALPSVMGLEPKAKDQFKHQVEQIAEYIHQLQ
jgi:hypothetical protein